MRDAMTSHHHGRFAPSPTGRLHLGNLRTALIAWLHARSHGGRFSLRVDDLDPDRARPEHERRQIADLAAIGIDFDGDPTRQSTRLDRYREALVQLASDDRTYPCFCSRAEVLAAASAPHDSDGVEAPYPGTCARLSSVESARRVAAGDPHCVRVRARGQRIGFDDLLLGHVEAVVDDFIVRRRDGVPAYNLASPIDESDLEIDEVLRGADLASTTPRQLWIARELRLRVPTFAHVPLVVGHDGERLAKRNGARNLDELGAAGMSAEGVRQLLVASLGDAVTADGFDLSQLPRAPWRVPSIA